jgi:hypothetical protein
VASKAAVGLRQVARNVESLPKKFARGSAKTVTKAIEQQMQVDTGGDRILSGTTRRGKVVKMRTRAKVTGDTIAIASIRPARPFALWFWLEYGTGEPGPTAAKHTWSVPARSALEHVRKDIRRQFSDAIG